MILTGKSGLHLKKIKRKNQGRIITKNMLRLSRNPYPGRVKAKSLIFYKRFLIHDDPESYCSQGHDDHTAGERQPQTQKIHGKPGSH